MIKLRKSGERGHVQFDWLDTRHTFSFGEYHDPAHMGFGPLRVINEDHVAPGRGFGAHPHRDMEIVTYVLDGVLEHKDNIGTGSLIKPGDVQRMSAGTGIVHSEFNHSKTDPVHLLQIWILPEKRGLRPGYEQKTFAPEEKRGRLKLIASPDGRDGSVTIHQDATLYVSLLPAASAVTHTLQQGREAWLQVIRGRMQLNGQTLQAGDGAAIEAETKLEIKAVEDGEVLLFDMK